MLGSRLHGLGLGFIAGPSSEIPVGLGMVSWLKSI